MWKLLPGFYLIDKWNQDEPTYINKSQPMHANGEITIKPLFNDSFCPFFSKMSDTASGQGYYKSWIGHKTVVIAKYSEFM